MRLLSTILLAVMLSAAPALLLADRPGALVRQAQVPGEQRFMIAQSNGPSLGEAVEQVRRQYNNGRIVSAETRMSGNREMHVIKVLTDDGKVKTERIPGRSRDPR
ncbi:MAG: hypothetical protein WDZ50_07905 [Woeseia sp.]